MGKKAFIILGNGFTIDFLDHLFKKYPQKKDKIDVQNLFRLGDLICDPWENKPSFLSYRDMPNLWTLGANPGNTSKESNSLIEQIITCSNMFVAFLRHPASGGRSELLTSEKGIYLKAYCELMVYFRTLFVWYNNNVSDKEINHFCSTSNWAWLKCIKSLTRNYEKVVFVTYNYDIWLERILRCLKIPFSMKGFDSKEKKIEIIKPHGSISFVLKSPTPKFKINYNFDSKEKDISSLKIQKEFKSFQESVIIPPAGDSIRLTEHSSVEESSCVGESWAETLRKAVLEKAKSTSSSDDVVLCGMSYWHVDRREIDELLLHLNPDVNFTFVNPYPPKTLNAVLMSIFKNYIQKNSSDGIQGVLNGN